MSKRCKSCHHNNDDELGFCSHCGEPLDVELQLIMEMKKATQKKSTRPVSHKNDEDDYVPKKSAPPPKKSPLPWIILGVVVLVVILLLVL